MRNLLLLLLLLLPGCLTQCGAISGGTIGDGAIGGLPTTSAACTIAETPAGHYAARLETGYSDTDAVGAVTDQGSLGANLTQATGTKQPTFVANDSILNAAAFSFDGGDILEVSSTFTALTTPVLMCVLVNVDSTSGGSKYIFDGSQTTVDHMYLWQSNANPIATIDDKNAGITSGFTAGTWQVLCGFTSGGGVADGRVSIDGTPSTFVTPTLDVNVNGFSMGARFNESLPFPGDIAEAIVFENTSLTRLDVQAYWECVYGVTFPAS